MQKFYVVMRYGKEVPTDGKQFKHYEHLGDAVEEAGRLANKTGVRCRVMECLGQVKPDKEKDVCPFTDNSIDFNLAYPRDHWTE